jgi:hypothetical protein
MKHITKLKLAAVHQICDVVDKSTEFMIQYMQDTCKVDYDTVINYLSLSDDEHSKLFKELNSLNELIINISNLE